MLHGSLEFSLRSLRSLWLENQILKIPSILREKRRLQALHRLPAFSLSSLRSLWLIIFAPQQSFATESAEEHGRG